MVISGGGKILEHEQINKRHFYSTGVKEVESAATWTLETAAVGLFRL